MKRREGAGYHRRSQAGLIYYPLFTDAGGAVTRQARHTAGLEKVVLMGADGLFSPDFLKAAGEAARGMYLSSPDFSVLGPDYAAFRENVPRQVWRAAPSCIPRPCLRCGDDDPGRRRSGRQPTPGGALTIGRQALLDALFSTKSQSGLTGSLTCNQYGDCADPHIAVYEIIEPDPGRWNPGAGRRPTRGEIWP